VLSLWKSEAAEHKSKQGKAQAMSTRLTKTATNINTEYDIFSVP
jgi:hypothetical protein